MSEIDHSHGGELGDTPIIPFDAESPRDRNMKSLSILRDIVPDSTKEVGEAQGVEYEMAFLDLMSRTGNSQELANAMKAFVGALTRGSMHYKQGPLRTDTTDRLIQCLVSAKEGLEKI